MAATADLLSTVEAIHAASLDTERRPDALRSLASLFGAAGATYEVFRTRPARVIDFESVDLPSQADLAYLADHALNNPRIARLFRKGCEPVLCDYMILDEREMARDAFYTGFLGAIGVRYFLSAQIVDTASNTGIVSVQRTPGQGHVERADIDRMRRLLPHLRQAHDVSVRLRAGERARRTLMQALDWLADGVVLVRGDGTVISANAAAQDLARRRDGVRIVNNQLDFGTGQASARFQAALGAVRRLRAGDPDLSAPGDFVAPRSSGSPSYLVAVRPLLARDAADPRADALVFIRDPLSDNRAMARTLRDVLGLTEAEADLARALRAGVPLSTYARMRAVSLNTVYTHLRRIKDKTGCKGMGTLIRRLNDLQVPLRDG